MVVVWVEVLVGLGVLVVGGGGGMGGGRGDGGVGRGGVEGIGVVRGLVRIYTFFLADLHRFSTYIYGRPFKHSSLF